MIYIEKNSHNKNRLCANRDGPTSGDVYIYYVQGYCIIFGQPSQAEPLFLLAVIFISKTRKEDDIYGNSKKITVWILANTGIFPL